MANDLRKATASLLAVSDSDETSFSTPTVMGGSIIDQTTTIEATISLAAFNNLLYTVAVGDGYTGTQEEFGEAFAQSLMENSPIVLYPSLEEFPDIGEIGKLYLAENTGKLYYYEDGDFALVNEPSEEDIKKILSNILSEEDNILEDNIENTVKDYLDDNLSDLISNGIKDNKDVVKESLETSLNEHPEILKDIINDEIKNNIAQHYEVISADDEVDDIDLINDVLQNTTPSKGDMFVIKHQIDGDLYDYTSYYFDGEKWCAMNGAISADNVYFNKDFVVTEPIGTIKNIVNGKAILEAKGKNLTQVMERLLAVEKKPTIIYPSISISSNTAKKFEVGSIIKPTWNALFDVGKYEYGPDTEVSVNSWYVTNNTTDETSILPTGRFGTYEVIDESNYIITAFANYSNGATPLSNFGEECGELKILNGTASKTTPPIGGYRKTFFGITTDNEKITPEMIRELESSTSNMKDGSTFSINIGEGATRVIIAYPATLGNISSVKKDGKYEVSDKFELMSMDIEGANGYKAIEYKVYVRTFDKERENDCVYNVII